ncbi:P-loop containing nucleoside triphosphate hydrolase protein [Imleria badia]|nr:P-loop containing nucleoside triphosphate hydrolase protein [Imleria badia]
MSFICSADALRRMYPGYSLVVSEDHRLTSLFTLPGVKVHSSDSQQEAGLEQVSNLTFKPTRSHIGGKVAGSLLDQPIFGSYKLTWNDKDFVVHITRFQNGNFLKTAHFILHEGPEQPARDFVLAACLYSEQADEEIWVFNSGSWSKNKTLWHEIKDSSWDDVVMKEESKKALQKDIYGFFKSEMTYKKLSIPWKRGLIMYGPPGNGKTISIKVVMKTCTERGFIPLYVKSFQSPRGEEASMENVFSKTRQFAPCVLILEDLDSLINDRNRSFFLNQLDGLEGNEGLLVIATTNHFDRLDAGLSNRPSRFDRKYLFDDPDYQERVLYVKYWQGKLKDNDEISFPESLVEEVADLTQGFSFAYLKEAFMSTLVRITNASDDELVEFPVVLKSQITILRKELGEDEQVSHVKQQSQEDAFSQSSLLPMQLPLPTDISPVDISTESMMLHMAEGVYKRPDNRSKSRAIGNVSGRTPFVSGSILHAPPSAYPHVMPGSLPSARPETFQDPSYPAWRAARVGSSASTSSVDTSRKNPFSLDTPPFDRDV